MRPCHNACLKFLPTGENGADGARLLRLGNRTHRAPRYADPEEAGVVIDKPKLIIGGEKASSPSRFLVRLGAKGWMAT